jgi:hypothetical protein
MPIMFPIPMPITKRTFRIGTDGVTLAVARLRGHQPHLALLRELLRRRDDQTALLSFVHGRDLRDNSLVYIIVDKTCTIVNGGADRNPCFFGIVLGIVVA